MAEFTAEMVKESSDRSTQIFSDQSAALREHLSGFLFQHVAKLFKDYDCIIEKRFGEAEKDITRLKGFPLDATFGLHASTVQSFSCCSAPASAAAVNEAVNCNVDAQSEEVLPSPPP